ncbi:hypothetical protein F753_07165 [Stutzerimonas chloritidismutans AW-1]|uniref:Uncharacterized protein n=2 Tax=Stutzerimonas stutzeri subgroup TaxID=578833 RepID=A0A061JPA8_STUST|nr:hypothetical protein L686_06425 [Stutzerimonas stutzeri MF28]ESR00099.1 hypothetical protein F753_07165 [Stutzerimonas chloritidismutans AW-1]EWC40433.1 hypothetical protein B597_014925 [Stutzerimonas stutzeri KOS6]
MRMVRQQIILDITNIRTSLWVLTRKDRQKPQKKSVWMETVSFMATISSRL